MTTMYSGLVALLAATSAPVLPSPSPSAPAALSITGWRLECSSASNALTCLALDEIRARAGGAVVSAISVRMPAAGKAPAIVVQVPLGVAIEDGVNVGFENGVVQKLAIYTCNREGCFASGKIGEPMLDAMRSAKAPLHVAFRSLDPSAGKQTVDITLGLDGFGAAFDRLR